MMVTSDVWPFPLQCALSELSSASTVKRWLAGHSGRMTRYSEAASAPARRHVTRSWSPASPQEDGFRRNAQDASHQLPRIAPACVGHTPPHPAQACLAATARTQRHGRAACASIPTSCKSCYPCGSHRHGDQRGLARPRLPDRIARRLHHPVRRALHRSASTRPGAPPCMPAPRCSECREIQIEEDIEAAFASVTRTRSAAVNSFCRYSAEAEG